MPTIESAPKDEKNTLKMVVCTVLVGECEIPQVVLPNWNLWSGQLKRGAISVFPIPLEISIGSWCPR